MWTRWKPWPLRKMMVLGPMGGVDALCTGGSAADQAADRMSAVRSYSARRAGSLSTSLAALIAQNRS